MWLAFPENSLVKAIIVIHPTLFGTGQRDGGDE
jgi:hypothetical protein